MNSPQSGIESYYECSLSNGPTPTVVSNFKPPNSGINTDGPHLVITEQPQTKFRFRYKSEMVGTHGQLKAESSDKNKNVYPTVKLCKWNKGPALIRLLLYTAEENDNERKRHVHELSGKNCNKEDLTGGCEVIVDEKTNYTATFPSLGIIHIAKRDVPNIIYQRKMKELMNLSVANNPHLRNEGIQHNVSPTEQRKMKGLADEEAKCMELNKVVLRFQAYFFDNEANCYRTITEHVDSDVIFNLKNASTGELKIVRMSAVSAPCSGGTEVWMLVEKVKKSNVKIKFYEVDKDNCELWRSYGEFKESDVHHQYAIVFKTPAYHSTNIRESVHVKVQLERPSDNDTSEPMDFTYTPDNLKRRNAFSERGEFGSHPKRRIIDEVLDLKHQPDNLFRIKEIRQPWSPETHSSKSPPHMVPVPSPIAPAASPSHGFYSPPHVGMSQIQQDDKSRIFVSNPEEISKSYISKQTESMAPEASTMQYMANISSNMYLTPSPEGMPHSPYQMNNKSPIYQQVPSPTPSVPSPYQQNFPNYSLSPAYSETNSNMSESERAFEQILQFDEVQKNFMNTKNTQDLDLSDIVSGKTVVNQKIESLDLLNLVNNDMTPLSNMFNYQGGEFTISYGDMQADSVRTNKQDNKDSKKKHQNRRKKSNDVDSLSRQMEKMYFSDSSKDKNEDNALNFALQAAESLKEYKKSGSISLLIALHKSFLNMCNNQGDNPLHLSVIDGNKDAVEKLLHPSCETYSKNLIDAQNINEETPLHLAFRGEHEDIINALLKHGCRTDIEDCEGNTALHLSAQTPYLKLVLSSKIKEKLINSYNYHGKTPLHLAVTHGSCENVKALLAKGAQVHLCERKAGANPLHIAVTNGHHDIVEYLIKNTDITVDAGMLDGNTALHIAALAKDAKSCKLLIDGKANPNATNGLRKSSDQDDEDESEDGEYFTPYDYADCDTKIVSILNGE